MPLRTQHEIAGESSDEEEGRRYEESFRAEDCGPYISIPGNSLEKVLRIPKAILNQNAGKECSDETPRHSSVSSTTRDPTHSN